MNPSNTSERSGLSLPTPIFELKEDLSTDKTVSGNTPEFSKISAQGAPKNDNTNTATKPSDPTTVSSQPDNASVSSSIQTTITPTAANDTDLIEKEWVNKAKQIVEKTKEDPHRQTKEVSQFKADYIKKRYNKDVKITDE